MIEDLLYPDNPLRRIKVMELRSDIIVSLSHYRAAWNKMAQMLNYIFLHAENDIFCNFRVLHLFYDIHKTPLDKCLNEISLAISDLKDLTSTLVNSLDIPNDEFSTAISKFLKSEQIDSIEISKEIFNWTMSFGSLSAIVAVTAIVSNFLSILTKAGVYMSITTISIPISIAIIGITGILSICFDSIIGAIERSDLEDAIKNLNQVKNEVSIPLENTTLAIYSVIDLLTDGISVLNEQNIIVSESGQSSIIHLPS